MRFVNPAAAALLALGGGDKARAIQLIDEALSG
jgi:hypothetical protein